MVMALTLLRWSIGLVLLIIVAQSPLRAQEPVCAIANTSIDTASSIRKLRIKRSVPCLVHDREKVKEYLLHAVRTKIPKEKLENDEYVGKALGFLPEDFDYASGIV